MSVYIDPKMTGEGGSDEGAERRSAAVKKKVKKPPQAPVSEASVLSGMEREPENTDLAKPEVAAPGAHGEADVNGHAESGDVDENEDSAMLKKPTKQLAPVDRNKFGKFIVSYGM